MKLDLSEGLQAQYKQKLKARLDFICFDSTGGQQFPFEKLFYLFQITEGQLAFQSYSAQMAFACQLQPQKSELAPPIVGTEQVAENQILADKILGTLQATPPKSVKIDAVAHKLAAYDKANGVQIDFAPAQVVDCLLTEPAFPKSSLIMADAAMPSRTLVLASAGHGKTTLLRRIAHFYCCADRASPENQALKNKYYLSGEYLPCIVSLRNLGKRYFDMQQIVAQAMVDVLEDEAPAQPSAPLPAQDATEGKAASAQQRMLLLIDGLDELSDARRLEFLQDLDEYLASNPQVDVIMTSRVAGLSTPGCKEWLKKMKFRGRSLLPLTDEEAAEYATHWITVTQPPAEQARQKKSLQQVLTENRFRHLREFMRTPLELIIILRQLEKDMLSLNRYHMFYDMFWELLTNHVTKQKQKKPVFDDMMTLLSFIAYQMQLNNALFISQGQLGELLDQLNCLNFYTDITSNGTLQEYLDCLDHLAANIGVIEREVREGEIVYLLPIRAYQEFLVAFACCHLRLLAGQARPDAYAVVNQHLADSQWFSITNFVLADLCVNRPSEFEWLISYLLQQVTDLERLASIVEADLKITSMHAQQLCSSLFAQDSFSTRQKNFLLTCVCSNSAYAYLSALQREQEKSPDSDALIWANAIAQTVRAYSADNSAWAVAFGYLQFSKLAKIGAAMLFYMAKAYLEEELQGFGELSEKVRQDLKISDEMLALLWKNACEHEDLWSLKALATLWLTQIEGSEKIEAFFGERFAQLVFAQVDAKLTQLFRQMMRIDADWKEAAVQSGKELMYLLGTVPFDRGLVAARTPDIVLKQLLKIMYEISQSDYDTSQVAMAIARLNYCSDEAEFSHAWEMEVCKGQALEYVRKENCRPREKNHFALVKDRVAAFVGDTAVVNNIAFMDDDDQDVFSLFREGRVLEAANFCVKTMGERASSTPVNLAFLLRYGKLDPTEIGDGHYRIQSLLSEGVTQGERYALLNMALYYIETNRDALAMPLLRSLTPDEWQTLCDSFWYTELWQPNKSPEGAFVCVLAKVYGNCTFDDYDEMCAVALQQYASFIYVKLSEEFIDLLD